MTRLMPLFVKSLSVIFIAGGILATNLQAQSNEITVSVSFPFAVGSHNLAPGTYRFSLMSSEFLLSVVDVKTGNRQIFDVHPEQQNSAEQRGRLIFRKSAGRRILNEIHFPGADTFSETIAPRPATSTETVRSTTSSDALGVGQP